MSATTSTQPFTSGMSRARIPCTISVPTPGHAKTVSVSTAPPSRYPAWTPMTVTIGTSAFLSAWRTTTRRSTSPFARAVRM